MSLFSKIRFNFLKKIFHLTLEMSAKDKRNAKKLQKKGSKESSLEESMNSLLLNPRTCTGVVATQELSRDLKLDSFSLSFHGKELITSTTLSLNFGRRYGLIGANGTGKSTMLKALAARDVPIPEHFDIYHLDGEVEPSDMTASEVVIELGRKEQLKLEAECERLMSEEGTENILEDMYARLDELDPTT